MGDSFQKRLADERSQLLIPQEGGNKFRANNKRDQLVAESGHLVHKLKAKDSTGRWAHYFIHVSKPKEFLFLRALKGKEQFDLEQYGDVIASNYGDKPSPDVLKMLRDKYGWNSITTQENNDD